MDNIERYVDSMRVKNDLHKVFDGPDGDKVLLWLMKVSGITKPSITTDTNLLLFRQGQQHIVLSILRALNRTPEQIKKHIEESMNHE